MVDKLSGQQDSQSGQLVDASSGAKAAQYRGEAGDPRSIPEDWQDKPAQLAQKDRDAHWTIKYMKAKQQDIALQVVSHSPSPHGLIRRWTTKLVLCTLYTPSCAPMSPRGSGFKRISDEVRAVASAGRDGVRVGCSGLNREEDT
jgi:hypothetical protein